MNTNAPVSGQAAKSSGAGPSSGVKQEDLPQQPQQQPPPPLAPAQPPQPPHVPQVFVRPPHLPVHVAPRGPPHGPHAHAGPPPPASQLRARGETVYAVEWTGEEQTLLDAGLARFPADRHTPLERYVSIAATLLRKTVRDVALRVKWMSINAASKKRKTEEAGAAAGAKPAAAKAVRRDRSTSIFAVQPSGKGAAAPAASHGPHATAPHVQMGPVPGGTALGTPVGGPLPSSMGGGPPMGGGMMGAPQPYLPGPAPVLGQPLVPNPLEDPAQHAVGGNIRGPVDALILNNLQILAQYKVNMANYAVPENTDLLARFRDNLKAILGHMERSEGVDREMPPLPVAINEEAAERFFATRPHLAYGPGMMRPMGGMIAGVSMYHPLPMMGNPPHQQHMHPHGPPHAMPDPLPVASHPIPPLAVGPQPPRAHDVKPPLYGGQAPARGNGGAGPSGSRAAAGGARVPAPPPGGAGPPAAAQPAPEAVKPEPAPSPPVPLRGGLRPNRSKPAGIRQSSRSGKG